MALHSDSVLFIAEVSANNLGSLERVKELVRSAARAGANAVKFQTYTAETMTLDIDSVKVSDDHELWGGQTLFSIYKEAYTPWAWHPELFELCRSLNVLPFSSPFDLTAVAFFESLDAPMYKIASLQTGDHRLIQAVAGMGKPLNISTGATELEEIEELVEVVQKAGNKDLTLLVCTSSYPAEPADAHILRVGMLKSRFGIKVGLSDHTLGVGVSIAAIALGATAIEKHLTLRLSDGGADSAFSMDPEEFSLLVEEGKNEFLSLGDSEWRMQNSEKESRRLRRSLYITKDVIAGEVISHENVRVIRPGGGCPSKHLDRLIGKRFKKPQSSRTPMQLELAG